MLKHICATTLTLGFLVSSADAQLVTRKDLTADLDVTMAQAAISACKAQGHNVSATIVGRAGEVIVQIRGDGACMHTFENSFGRPGPREVSGRHPEQSSSALRTSQTCR